MEIPLYGIPSRNWTNALYNNQTWSAKCWGMERVNYTLPEGLKFALQAREMLLLKVGVWGTMIAANKRSCVIWGLVLVGNLTVQKW